MNYIYRILSVVLFCLVLNLTYSTALGEESRRDGNWWIYQAKGFKLVYILGFFDGMHLGHKFSYWEFWEDKKKDKAKEKCLYDVAKSFSSNYKKYFGNVTNDQIVDGLDTFYSDYRNRSIRVHGAIWLVVNEISGTPKEEMDTLIEGWRKNTTD